MNTLAASSPMINELGQLKARLKVNWMAGDYDIFSRYMELDAHLFFRRIGVEPGQKLLDVGCGAGQLALIAARAGANVTGCDIATNWVERAQQRASREGLSVTFDEGDAEALPYADAQFNVVTSLIGAMFAPRPDLVASEFTRVCRPGGRIAMANWTAQGFVGQMFKAISKYIAPNGMPSPLLWGEESVVRERFNRGIFDLRCTRRFYQFEYPFPPELVVDFFRENYGPMTRAFDALGAEGQAQLKSELVTLWSSHNRAAGAGTLVDAEYLEVIAYRGEDTVNIADAASMARGRKRESQRAALLADRIEEGAARLVDFAERLSSEQWKMRVVESGQLGRSVGVIVHHVASMYPIEVSVARTVADGKSVTDVTWQGVAEINARHAYEFSNPSKEATLDLLRENGAEAVAAVREFTDEELDRAAPFSLSFGAPATAQFVLEDHAVRHSWHHLARIRNAVGQVGPNPSSRIQ